MLLTPRAAAFLAPLIVTLVVAFTHAGPRSGLYSSSRPDSGIVVGFALEADGYMTLHDGLPFQSDTELFLELATLFRGAPGAAVTGIEDDRPFVPFLLSLLGAGVFGAYWCGLLLNLVAFGVASACAVDFVLRLGHPPLTAAAFGCMVAGLRSAGFYIGMPDAHAFAYSSVPIVLWLFERLELSEPEAPWANAVLVGFATAAALLTYMATVSLLAAFWLIGLGRVRFVRLVAICVIAVALFEGWRVPARAAGLEFHPMASGSISTGLGQVAGIVRSTVLGSFATSWEHRRPASGTLDALRSGANAVADALLTIARDEPARAQVHRMLIRPLVPAYGGLLLVLAAIGLVVASRRERRFVLALFLPPLASAAPLLLCHDAPRFAYLGVFGLALSASLGLAAFGRVTRRLAERLGGSGRAADLAEVAAVAIPLVALLVLENADAWGDRTIPRLFHFAF